MGFIIHFYIIFGTNLIAQGPAQIAIFFAYFSVSQKRNIKRSPNGMKPSGELFLEQTQSRRLGVNVKQQTRKPRGREVRPHPRGPLVAPLTNFFRLYMSIYPKNIGEQNRSGDPPPEASLATENQYRPVMAPCRRGESLSDGHLHHPGTLHDKEGVVLPRG